VKKEHDERERRCRRLGHEVPFSYCRSCGAESLPCRLIYDCWFETFDITAYMNEHYTEEERAAVLAPPGDKMVSIFELIKKAQQVKDSAPED
jgi:hypothetical protein